MTSNEELQYWIDYFKRDTWDDSEEVADWLGQNWNILEELLGYRLEHELMDVFPWDD